LTLLIVAIVILIALAILRKWRAILRRRRQNDEMRRHVSGARPWWGT
jgi:hypothetical protein